MPCAGGRSPVHALTHGLAWTWFAGTVDDMGKVRKRLRKQWVDIRQGPTLASWVKVVPVVGGFVLFLAVTVAVFTPGGDKARTDDFATRADDVFDNLFDDLAAPVPSGVVPAPSATAPSQPDPVDSVDPAGSVPVDGQPPVESDPVQPPDTTAPPVAPPGSPTAPVGDVITLPFRFGGVLDVSQEALNVARSACEAIFTGNFDAVALGPGVVAPALPRTFPDPEVSSPEVVQVGDGTVTISFLVDPDRTGPEGLRRIDVNVGVESSGWVWLGV
jgi:hypothetical protein